MSANRGIAGMYSLSGESGALYDSERPGMESFIYAEVAIEPGTECRSGKLGVETRSSLIRIYIQMQKLLKLAIIGDTAVGLKEWIN